MVVGGALLLKSEVALLSSLMASATEKASSRGQNSLVQRSVSDRYTHQPCGNLVEFHCTGGFSVTVCTAIVQLQHLLVIAKSLVNMGTSAYPFLKKFKKPDHEGLKQASGYKCLDFDTTLFINPR